MCGIAGFVDRDGSAGSRREQRASVVQAMCDVIRHRGPDDEGFYVHDGVALGMRRLSIIDVATGHQPITNEDATIWVVFNGEIYNYRALRAALERRGHSFRTATDTETIVHAYEEWGEAAFSHLRGMFSIALWDGRARTLLLVRDRAGIKPLFYAESARGLVFGSEIKAILASGEVTPELDPQALDHYLSFLYTPRTGSIFKGIRKLPPGHLLSWSAGRFDLRPYWTLPNDETFQGSDGDAVRTLRAVLADAVSSHMISDVPIGAFLSGGIDSGVVVGLMAEASARPVKTFSIGFDEPDFDELAAARRTAAHFATDHHEFVVRPDALSILESLVDHFDEPFGDVSAIPTWYVSQMAAQQVTVALSGDGGDELFGGYDRYFAHPRVEAFDRWAGAPGRRLAGAAWPWIPHGRRGRNFLRHVAQDRRRRYVDAVSYFQPDEKTALFSAGFLQGVDTGLATAALAGRFEAFAGLDWHSQMMRVDFETYLPEDVLAKVDRTSMAHSLESRVPLLDHAVVQFAASLPSHMKIRAGERKHIFRRVAAAILPAEVLTRRKQGFAVPIGAWFRGRLRDVFVETLQSTRARQRGYFDTGYVDRLIGEHVSGKRDHAMRLWQLLMFELWHQRYLDQAWPQQRPARMPLFRSEAPALP
jgi:asparagine synthase (glutamine-hydrolysing)